MKDLLKQLRRHHGDEATMRLLNRAADALERSAQPSNLDEAYDGCLEDNATLAKELEWWRTRVRSVVESKLTKDEMKMHLTDALTNGAVGPADVNDDGSGESP